MWMSMLINEHVVRKGKKPPCISLLFLVFTIFCKVNRFNKLTTVHRKIYLHGRALVWSVVIWLCSIKTCVYFVGLPYIQPAKEKPIPPTVNTTRLFFRPADKYYRVYVEINMIWLRKPGSRTIHLCFPGEIKPLPAKRLSTIYLKFDIYPILSTKICSGIHARYDVRKVW